MLPRFQIILLQQASQLFLNSSCTSQTTKVQSQLQLLSQRRNTSTKYNMAMHGHSAACCSIPPIVTKDYEHKGKYETINGIKTYVTGPPSATKAILFIFDIFGYWPQTLQGADILAFSGAENKYKVYMPDWFNDQPADVSWYPPQTEEAKKNLGAFFQGTGAPGKTAERVPAFVEAVKKMDGAIESWGIVGFCWGGKIVSLTSGTNTLFKAAAECHPAMVDPSEATSISIPLCMLASKDEPAKDVEAFGKNLKGEKHVETFGDQVHGWMGARGNLEDKKVKEEYERGYRILVEWFGKHL